MSLIQEFKVFISRGNVIDMAVGVIIGGAFGKIVSSIVDDIIMPVVGYLLNGIDFKQLYINLSNVSYSTLAKAEAAGAPIIKYGTFINTIINFFIITASIFLVVKIINRFYQQKIEEAPATPEDVLLLREIRDLLDKK